MKRTGSLYLGVGLLLAGLIVFAQNVSIISIGFFRIGGFGTGGTLIVLFVLCLAALVAKPCKLTGTLLGGVGAAMVLSLLLGMSLYLHRISLLSLLLILACIAAGIGFLIRYFLHSVHKQ